MSPFTTREFFAPFYPKNARHRFVTMIRAYYDDSGTHAQSAVVVAGGAVFRDEQHDLLKDPWNAILQPYGLTHFHLTKLKSGKEPPYCDMDESEKEALLDQLLIIMSERVALVAACAISRAGYETILTGDEKARYGNPYALAAQTFWMLIGAWAEHNHYTDVIPLVAESGNKDEEKRLSEIFNKVVANPALASACHLETLTYAPKNRFVGLQAADIVANGVHDNATHIVAGGRLPSKWMTIIDVYMNKMPSRVLVLTHDLLRQYVDAANEYYK